MADTGEYSSLHGTCCSNPSKCALLKDDDELEDDVFSLDRRVSVGNFNTTRASIVRSSGYVSDLSPSPRTEPLDLAIRKPSADVMTQTDFPIEEETTDDVEVVELPLPQPSEQSPRREQHVCKEFCWRHDGYSDVASPPARPSSPCSDEQNKDELQSAGATPRVGYRHQSCQICKTQLEKRLDIRSRKELTNAQKVSADPTVARVTSCPINLLADKISRCSNLWTEDRTFYLGVDAAKVEQNARRHSARLPSRHSGKPLRRYDSLQTRSCSFCNDEDTDDVTSSKPSVACGRHSFWIRSLTLARDSKMRPMTTLGGERGVTGKRNWILVQCVTKHSLKPLCSAEPEPKLFYREIGVQEMILCPAQNRTVEVIEDICCQHFIQLSREAAVEGGRTIELLFSPKGPMVRDDKHLAGRSIFYFCCDEPQTRRELCDACKAANEARNAVPPPPVFAVPPASPRDKQARSHRRRSSNSIYVTGASSLTSPLGSMVRARGRRKAKASSRSGLASPDNFTAPMLQERSSATNAYASASAEQSEKPSPPKAEKPKRERRRKSEGMAKVVEKNEDQKKSVTFADREDEKDEEPPQIDPAALKRRASLPPPPPKLIPKKEGIERSKKRRESVRISFSEVPQTVPKKEKADESPKKPAPVRAYNQPQWDSILVIVHFKEERYKQEFLEYKTLQDLYTWLRQKFLEKEVLTPGAELMLHHDNLKFPLKANTANTQLSNLPTAEFTCEEISKEQQGGGFGEGSSRFDTRFSLPIDMRSLEKLTPCQYLAKFCKLPPTWRAFYRNTFTQNDRDRDGILTFKELDQAMEHLFVELSIPLLNRILFLMGIDPRSRNLPEDEDQLDLNSHFQRKQADVAEQGRKRSVPTWQSHLTVDAEMFISMCALGNRIICRENDIDGYPVDSIKQRGTELEDADFYNIEGKLKTFDIYPATRKLLIYIRNR